MQALVLAGGEGTRLRPLTYTTPKPVMPLAGRPFLSYMLDWVRSHGVDEAILSCGFRPEGVKSVLRDIYDGMRLRNVLEEIEGEVPTNRINAAAYVLVRYVVERIPAGRAVSFKREVSPGWVGDTL